MDRAKDLDAATVLASRDGAVARIVLNRPAKKNALTRAALEALRTALDEAFVDDTVRVVALSGAGDAFCAGQDLAERDPRRAVHWPPDLAAIQAELYHPILRSLRVAQKPVVALVEGIASGAGAGLALACDVTLATDDARFAFSFVRIGLSVDAGLGQVLASRLGPARARALLMLGESLTGSEAAQAGLIWRSAPEGAAFDALAAATVAALAAAPRRALAAIKSAVVAAEDLGFEDYLAREAALQGEAAADADYREGVLAFLEKREPRWR
ncbi:MAG: enoyl-CoA hydratase/isomerase family protein [Hyphomicrobiales bacterium]|nr:enoyl-CoA hydratase/isomerase family protein [Hyphomicrobiales bacterium]MDE2016561.1 enoyl-CoA hydratase/isomerase family protein [Hyphomicrobiales bacterium]